MLFFNWEIRVSVGDFCRYRGWRRIHTSESVCAALVIIRIEVSKPDSVLLPASLLCHWDWRRNGILMLSLLLCEQLLSQGSSHLNCFCFQDSRQFNNVQALVLVFQAAMSGLLLLFIYFPYRRFLIPVCFYMDNSYAGFVLPIVIWICDDIGIIYKWVMAFYNLKRTEQIFFLSQFAHFSHIFVSQITRILTGTILGNYIAGTLE